MPTKKTYWKSVDQLEGKNPMIQDLKQNEFVEKLPVDSESDSDKDSGPSRRDFLKYVGFSTAAATLAACEGPVIKSVPYVVQPERIIPGIANYYATTIADGFDFASILIKTREGRPIKVESNKTASTNNSANARVHASVLSMYDTLRLQGPMANGIDVSWEDFYLQIEAKLKAMAVTNKSIVLLTQTLASPTTQSIIDAFIARYPNVRQVTYDTISENATVQAFENIYGIRAMADYDFSKAHSIVSVAADIVGDWQGGGFDRGYAQARVPNGNAGKKMMSKHFQFESNMSLSGANADHRVPATPNELKNILASIAAQILGKTDTSTLKESHQKQVANAVKSLRAAGKKGVLVTGIDDVAAQELAIAVNQKIASEAFEPEFPKLTRQGNTQKVLQLFKDIQSKKVNGLITFGINPLLTLAEGPEMTASFKELDLSLAFVSKEDETAAAAQYVAAVPHYLEAWGDYELKKGHYALSQPTIKPLFDTQQFQDVLLKLSGSSSSYYECLKTYWNNAILFGASWNQTLHDGYIHREVEGISPQNTVDVSKQIMSLATTEDAEMQLVLYTKTGMGDGQQANNPWLQEFPDPVTRVSWDNYLSISKKDADRIGLKNINVANGALNGSYAKITVNGKSLTAPVLIQPGQAPGSVGLALGYGQRMGLKEEMQVGVNAYPLYLGQNKIQDITISPADGYHEFACVQLHNTMMGRGDIVKETTLEIFNTKDSYYWNPVPEVSKNHMEMPVTSSEVDMWQEFDRSIGHHFNLSIDLNACTGCGACVIACHAENNVPVVGKTEIRKSRDMHWLRIDRYYSSDVTFEEDLDTKENISGLGDSLTTFGKMEQAAENPQVTFQPVMCQHCNHAPCETVCPVAASSHGRQGQNHMAYNRCVGTRYCANNCPYKVRRFNWFLYNQNDEFDYHMNNDLGRMVLNPDVVVRSRGVMEKCSMCIQMTQKTILDAKLEGRQIKDGEFQTACSNACDSGALVFGDINDKESQVAQLNKDSRMYHLLEHVGTKPNVMYQVKVRNTDQS